MPAGHTCPVCDYPNLSEPPRSEFGGGSFEICPSCGFQFGVNDDDEGISYETWRRRWEAAGMPWSSVALKRPASWVPVAKHVAPGGAALRRPGAAPASEPAPATETPRLETPAPAAKTPAPAKAVASSNGKKAAAPTKQPTPPARTAKPAKVAKSAKTAKPAKAGTATKAPATKAPAAKKAAAKKTARR